jgi:hypothetical protein
MRETPISVTEAARNFADCINRARYQDTTFVLLRNGVPVAKITPSTTSRDEKELEKRCTGGDLAEALGRVSLSDEELQAWQADIESARNALKAPEEAWD